MLLAQVHQTHQRVHNMAKTKCSEETIRKLQKQKNSLYRNINLAKCKGTSKKKGSKGSPTDKDFKNAKKTAKKK